MSRWIMRTLGCQELSQIVKVCRKWQAPMEKCGWTGECESTSRNLILAVPDAKTLAKSCVGDANAVQGLDNQCEDDFRVIVLARKQESVVLVAQVVEDRSSAGDALEDGNATICTQGDCTFGGRVLVTPTLNAFGVGVED